MVLFLFMSGFQCLDLCWERNRVLIGKLCESKTVVEEHVSSENYTHFDFFVDEV